MPETYRKWHFPTSYWSGEAFGEDTLVLVYDLRTGSWSGKTENDQCDKRDLTPEEAEAAARDFEVDREV